MCIDECLDGVSQIFHAGEVSTVQGSALGLPHELEKFLRTMALGHPLDDLA